MNTLVLLPIVMAVLFVGAPSSASAADEGRRPHAQGQYDPAAAVYVVAPGDDLQDIAGRFGVKVADLREWNDLASDKIHVGEKLEVVAGAQLRVLSRRCSLRLSQNTVGRRPRCPIRPRWRC